MQVKRIVAPDMRRALQAVREKLGPDAIILSNKRVPEGIELLCTAEAAHVAVDGKQTPVGGTPTPLEKAFDKQQTEMQRRAEDIERRLAARLSKKRSVAEVYGMEAGDGVNRRPGPSGVVTGTKSRADTSSPRNDALVKAGDSSRDEIADLRQELATMRQLFQQQWEGIGWQRYTNENPLRAALWRRLSRMGLQAATIKRLLNTPYLAAHHTDGREAWQKLLHHLVAAIPIMPRDIISEGGIHAFVGPTGVGKTTTIGKLAAQYVLTHGCDEVALVTTDVYRIAAHEQLRAMGRILNVPVKVVEQPEHLSQVLHSLRDKSLILIDTAGIGAADQGQMQQLAALADLKARINTWLLMSATAQYPVLTHSLTNYASAGLKGCMITKLDEALSLGEVISATIESGLPVGYVTHGQKIPDDVQRAKGRVLVQKAVHLLREPVEEEDLAQAFASLGDTGSEDSLARAVAAYA